MNKAFTIIEVLIVIGIFVVAMVGVMQLYLVFGRAIDQQKSSIDVALDGSTIMDAVHTAGLQASHVVASHTFSGVSYTSATTTAIFELPAVDSTGAVIVDTYDYIGIYASGTNVYRVTDVAAGSSRAVGNKLLTDSLGVLSFTYDNISFPSVASITVDATTSAMVKGQAVQTHLREHIYLRNL